MKRRFFIVLGLVLSFTLQSNAQSEMLENGLSIKFSFGFPSSEYGLSGDIPLPEELRIKKTYGLELGSQWYLLKREQFGLGLDVNWFDAVYGRAKMDNIFVGTVNFMTLEVSFLEFGPVATFALSDKIAVEGYYNLRPTYFVGYYYENSDDYVLVTDFSFMHGLGFGVRLKFIYIGYEYTFGSADGEVNGGGEFDDVGDLYFNQKMDGTNSKLIIGFQF